MTEEQWVTYIKTFKPRPPMPWWSMKETTEQDLRAMYQYVKSLGPAGQPAHPYLTPDKEPKQPYSRLRCPPNNRPAQSGLSGLAFLSACLGSLSVSDRGARAGPPGLGF